MILINIDVAKLAGVAVVALALVYLVVAERRESR